MSCDTFEVSTEIVSKSNDLVFNITLCVSK